LGVYFSFWGFLFFLLFFLGGGGRGLDFVCVFEELLFYFIFGFWFIFVFDILLIFGGIWGEGEVVFILFWLIFKRII